MVLQHNDGQLDLFDIAVFDSVDSTKALRDLRSSLCERDEQANLYSEYPVHHLFDPPSKSDIHRLNQKTAQYRKKEGGLLDVKTARLEIERWKEHAQRQLRENRSENAKKVVLSLFDYTGNWSKPWREAGYNVFQFDIQSDPEVGNVFNFSPQFFADYFGDFDGLDIYAILAACPCTDFASSGSRHFAAKDLNGTTQVSIDLVHQTLATIEYFRPAMWAIENPVGRIASLTGLPPWRTSFDPNDLGDPYTKKTILWGRFNGDLPIAPVEPTEGSKMWKKYGGKSQATKNARSVTPEGFSYGFFMANNAVDHPSLEARMKYDRLDPELMSDAISNGYTAEQIGALIDDFYYIEMDDGAAEKAIRDLISSEPGQQLQP